MIRTLLIDDEDLARSVIKNFLKDYPDVTIVGEAANGFDGLKQIQENAPDLILLDVQMPKLNGFEMLELIDPENRPMVIFCTAFDEYALRAFEQNAVDYLLKPFTRDRLLEAVGRVVQQQSENNAEKKEAVSKTVNELRTAGGPLDRIVVRQGTRIIIIPVDEIDHIQAEDDYVSIHTGGKKYLRQMTMKHLEEALPPDQFARIHRSHIVSVRMIDRLEAYSKDSYLAVLTNGEKLPVSRSGYQTLRGILGF